jgi:Spy/CpxP family protein refolding chaperone
MSAKLQFLRGELSDMLLDQQAVDMDSLRQIQIKILEDELTLEEVKIDAFLQIGEVLTPEQKQQFLHVEGRSHSDR